MIKEEEHKIEADISTHPERNPYDIVKELLKETVDQLKLSENIYHILKKPMRVLEVSIPIRKENGMIHNYTGYRSQHLDILGPTKGGIRFHPSVSLDEVKALSIWMSLKSAILELPLGGGKGGVIVNPHELTERELEELSRSYIRKITPIVGPKQDIPAPDMNTSPEIMGWMIDEYDKLQGYNIPGLITGKPVIIGGSEGRLDATGRGVVIAIREAANIIHCDLSRATAAIQGFGNVGEATAQFLDESGVEIVAITDVSGGIYNADGLNIAELSTFINEGNLIADYKKADEITNDEMFALPVDILIPAAITNQITEATAPSIQAKIVAEAANGPTTPKGNAILEEKGVFVIPDILCNAGGVTVSYFEWVQNTMNYYWKEEEVNEKLEEKMMGAFQKVYEMKTTKQCDMRKAAYMVGVNHLTTALRARGWIKNGDLSKM